MKLDPHLSGLTTVGVKMYIKELTPEVVEMVDVHCAEVL